MNIRIRKTILIWEITGVFFLISVGSLLHFTYEWSNHNPIIGLFSPINESVWEHLKLGFTSLMIFSLIEYFFMKNISNNFFTAKALGIFILQITIIVTFYTYTTFTGTEILIIDILSYIIGAILCQIISYKLLVKNKFNNKIKYLSLSFIFTHAILLFLFTFYPPKLPIFKDSNTNSYGISCNIESNKINDHIH